MPPSTRTRPAPVSRLLRAAATLGGMMALLMWADGAGGAAFLVLLLIGAAAVARAVIVQQRRREQAQIRAARSYEIAPYHAMSPRQFEEAIAFLCQRDGCRDVRVVGGAGDLGADVLAVAPDGRRVVIQCKRYGPTSKVGSPDVQRFGGTCWSVHRGQVAAVVTTSVFTRPAAAYAVQHGIRCFDADGLAGWASRTGPTPWM